MSQQSLLPPSGTRDFLPEDASYRLSIFKKIRETFERHGFSPFDTPAFERIETLMGKYGDEGEKLIFKILKRGEKESTGVADFALRYDLTVPTMRVYAGNKHKLPGIFKRYQIAPVWRADRPGKGRFREFYQCDVDIFGSTSTLAEAEIITTLTAALHDVGLQEFTVKMNSRKLLAAMTQVYKLSDNTSKKVLIILDKLDKIGLDGVITELNNIEDPLDLLMADLTSGNYTEKFLGRVTSIELGQEGNQELQDIMQHLKILSPALNIQFDPLMVRGLDYYTGCIFEIVSAGFSGTIAAGGRYDNLGKSLAGVDVPVCGGSLGLERILLLLESQKSNHTTGPDIYVTLWDKDAIQDAQHRVKMLRDAGINAELDLTQDKIGNQLKMADKRNCRFALIQGPDEKATNNFILKNLTTATQEKLSWDEVIHNLNSRLKR